MIRKNDNFSIVSCARVTLTFEREQGSAASIFVKLVHFHLRVAAAHTARVPFLFPPFWYWQKGEPSAP